MCLMSLSIFSAPTIDPHSDLKAQKQPEIKAETEAKPEQLMLASA